MESPIYCEKQPIWNLIFCLMVRSQQRHSSSAHSWSGRLKSSWRSRGYRSRSWRRVRSIPWRSQLKCLDRQGRRDGMKVEDCSSELHNLKIGWNCSWSRVWYWNISSCQVTLECPCWFVSEFLCISRTELLGKSSSESASSHWWDPGCKFSLGILDILSRVRKSREFIKLFSLPFLGILIGTSLHFLSGTSLHWVLGTCWEEELKSINK